MAASFAGTSVFSVSGFVSGPMTALEDVSRPGANGVAYRRMQVRAEPFTVIVKVDCTNLTAADDLYFDWEALVGTVVDVTDDYGEAYTDDLVLLNVKRRAQSKMIKSVGGVLITPTSDSAWLEVEATLRSTFNATYS